MLNEDHGTRRNLRHRQPLPECRSDRLLRRYRRRGGYVSLLLFDWFLLAGLRKNY